MKKYGLDAWTFEELKELSIEMQGCIEVCNLKGEELSEYIYSIFEEMKQSKENYEQNYEVKQ